MRTADVITEKLTAALAPESLRVVDESHLHAGHAGHRPEGQTHYRVYIVTEAFRGKTRIDLDLKRLDQFGSRMERTLV